MSKDRRVKGCPNEECVMHLDKKKMDSDNEFCPKCGTKLIYVCTRCFTEIENLGTKHRKCKRCEAEADAKKEKAKDLAKNAVAKVGAAGVAVGGAVVAGMQKEGVKQAASVGKEVVKKAVEVVPKVIKK